MIKKINFLLLLMGLASLAPAQQKTVKLSGTLINFGNSVRVGNQSEYGQLIPNSQIKIIIPDTSGNFSCELKMDKPGYYFIGKNNLYLIPGEDLEMYIDSKNEKLTTFSGAGKEAEDYLKGTLYPAAGSFIWGGKNISTDPGATLNYITNAAADRLATLESLQHVSDEFKRLEKARIQADILISITAVPVYVQYARAFAKTSPGKQDSFIREFKLLAAPVKKTYTLNFVDVNFLKITSYRDMVGMLIKDAPDDAQVKQINDLQKSYQLVHQMLTENNKAKLALFQTTIDSIQTADYRGYLNRYLKVLLKFGNGDNAINITARDIQGKPVKLSSFKGKVIYVDLWATWCGPCMAEMPYLETLKKIYANNPKVVFISLSIDEDANLDLWKQNVSKRQANGYQWQISPGKITAYNVSTIPRVLLIDQNFRIADMNAPTPSQKNVGEAIDKLLK
jgi:thiol-disulfide isomerase/thioredoxin